MAKGTIAKENVEKKIAAAFGDNYIGNIDKKLYVWANDGAEMVQIAISLTCPKTPVGGVEVKSGGDLDFSDGVGGTVVKPEVNVEITEQEKENLADLLAKFGL